MISTNDLRAGQAIIHNGRICVVSDYERMKPGKGPTFVRVKLKDVSTGRVLDHTWRGEQKVELAILQSRPHQFLYRQGDQYTFMDLDTYEQITLDSDFIGDVEQYLAENMEISITCHNNKPVKVEVPTFVEMKVVKTDPGVKGDTVSNTTKPATIESGAVVQVPLFVAEGDVIRVDTRTDTYITRV